MRETTPKPEARGSAPHPARGLQSPGPLIRESLFARRKSIRRTRGQGDGIPLRGCGGGAPALLISCLLSLLIALPALSAVDGIAWGDGLRAVTRKVRTMDFSQPRSMQSGAAGVSTYGSTGGRIYDCDVAASYFDFHRGRIFRMDYVFAGNAAETERNLVDAMTARYGPPRGRRTSPGLRVWLPGKTEITLETLRAVDGGETYTILSCRDMRALDKLPREAVLRARRVEIPARAVRRSERAEAPTRGGVRTARPAAAPAVQPVYDETPRRRTREPVGQNRGELRDRALRDISLPDADGFSGIPWGAPAVVAAHRLPGLEPVSIREALGRELHPAEMERDGIAYYATADPVRTFSNAARAYVVCRFYDDALFEVTLRGRHRDPQGYLTRLYRSEPMQPSKDRRTWALPGGLFATLRVHEGDRFTLTYRKR